MKLNTSYFDLGRVTALLTFLIASFIFACYYITSSLDYGFYGYFFFLLAVPVNLLILIILFAYASKAEQPKRIRRSMGLMLLNIPVAIVYFSMATYLTGVMRITIDNSSGKDITNIQINGCESKELNGLKNGESETVWIRITGDCSISMFYQVENGSTQLETLVGYVSNGMGQKFTYRIGQGEAGW